LAIQDMLDCLAALAPQGGGRLTHCCTRNYHAVRLRSMSFVPANLAMSGSQSQQLRQ
jgi:hypothetical protein